MSLEKTLVTSRLEGRPSRELDRARSVELFCNDDFMNFSGQALTEEAAHGRFDHMLAMCKVVPFARSGSHFSLQPAACSLQGSESSHAPRHHPHVAEGHGGGVLKSN